MRVSVESLWIMARTLSNSDRILLSRKLRESVKETEEARRERAAKEINAFFGGWSNDPRTSEEMMNDIRQARTTNTFPTIK